MIGIYKITNKINDKVYIGLSIYLDQRINNHKVQLISNRHPNYLLQAAWNEDGEENFYFDVIDVVKTEDYSRDMLEELETSYIKKYSNNCYNIAKTSKIYNKRRPRVNKRTSKIIEYDKLKKLGNLDLVNIPLTQPKEKAHVDNDNPDGIVMVNISDSLDYILVDSDYDGSYSLKRSERILIIKAALFRKSNRRLMAKALGLSQRTLYRKIIQHGLSGIV